MPRPKRRVLVGSFGLDTRPKLDWELIEKAYGHPLDHAVRRKVDEVTTELVSGATFEQKVVPVGEARKEIKRILSAVEQLLRPLTKSSKSVDGAWYARHLLMNHIRDPLLPNPTVMPYRDPVQAVSQILTSCVTACRRSLEELEDPDWSVEEGEAWKRWINRLTVILEEADLSTAARKDDEGVDKPSAFVSLVAELQACLPSECRRHTASDQTLAGGINRARAAKT